MPYDFRIHTWRFGTRFPLSVGRCVRHATGQRPSSRHLLTVYLQLRRLPVDLPAAFVRIFVFWCTFPSATNLKDDGCSREQPRRLESVGQVSHSSRCRRRRKTPLRSLNRTSGFLAPVRSVRVLGRSSCRIHGNGAAFPVVLPTTSRFMRSLLADAALSANAD